MAEKSKYAEKRASGNMMYGPGCCAHTLQITDAVRERMAERKRKIAEEERKATKSRIFRQKFRTRGFDESY